MSVARALLPNVAAKLRRQGITVIAIAPHPRDRGQSPPEGFVVAMASGAESWTLTGESFRALPRNWRDKPHEPIKGPSDTLGPLGRLIAAERKRRGWTVQQLADTGGVGRQQVSDWLNGRSDLGLSKAEAMMAALGIAVTTPPTPPTTNTEETP